MTITDRLLALADLPYRDFNAALIPSVDKERIIGVRTPALRSLAKQIVTEEPEAAKQFLKTLPHYYYEENNLHAFIIEQNKDFEEVIQLIEAFLPYIDNWATCDTFSPKILLKYPNETLEYIKKWLQSSETYTVRYAIGLLLSNYLDAEFKEEHLAWVAGIKSEEYYINMMIAWYFATALAKQYKATIPYIEGKKLSAWVQHKTIQKARESRRISADTKEYLLQFKLANVEIRKLANVKISK